MDETVAHIRRPDGGERELNMMQRWGVRQPIPRDLYRRRITERLYPDTPIITTQRIIDTFLPIALV